MAPALSNSLASIAETIKSQLAEAEAAARWSVDKSIEAGHALTAAKAECRHGQWLPFLARAGIHERQARRLMQLSQSGVKSDTVSDLGGIKATLDYISKRTRCVEILRSVELDEWAKILNPDGSHNEEAAKAINPKILDRDIERLTVAMQLMQELHDQFGQCSHLGPTDNPAA